MPIPDNLPSDIIIPNDNDDLGGMAYLSSPTQLDTCDFVDTNPVMEQFSDVIDGRCMENFTFGENSDDPLQQSTTVMSWWIYSFNHQAVNPGKYYLQSWLTTMDDNTTVAQG